MSPLGRIATIVIGCIAFTALFIAQRSGQIPDGSSVSDEAPVGAVEPSVTLAFGGDVLLGEDVNAYVARHGAMAPLADVPELRDASFAFVNLESVVAPGADAVDTGRIGDYFFLGRPETLAVLEAAGIDGVATANNHAHDFGALALAAEDRLLTSMGMAHPGTGTTPAEACSPSYFEKGELRIALFSIDTTEPAAAADPRTTGTCYLAPGDSAGWDRVIGSGIADARRQADVILVIPHVRASFQTIPDPADRAAVQHLIDLGADAVLTSGAHALQGIEVRNGRPILHNAGSLLFNFPEPDDAAIFVLGLSPAGVTDVRTVPLITERSRTRAADPEESEAILAAIDARSGALGTTTTGGQLRLDPEPRQPPTDRPDHVATVDPGPAPGPLTEPPSVCTTDVVPAAAELSPSRVGPLTLVGARTERPRMDGPALIWLDTFWRVDGPIPTDLQINAEAIPVHGTPWYGLHEPCDWAWPTSRWKPGVLYRDRYPLRPPPEVLHLGGLPAILSSTGYGPLAITVTVEDEGRSLGTSGAVRTVTLDPSVTARSAIIVGLGGAIGLILLVVLWWRRGARIARRSLRRR